MKKLSLQSRIAFNIIVSTMILMLVLCSVILSVFRLHTDQYINASADMTIADVEELFGVLLQVCCTGCLVILFLLFLISWIIAKKSMGPIREIIKISNTITHNNLSARIPLPGHKDELYKLSETINNLLDRIEYAVEREKSFTSYASHEFRTPLAVLKGTMEVLIRRPRSEAEYTERITACIQEVDKLNDMVEQLLVLTRYEEGKRSLKYDLYPVEDLINNSVCLVCDTILQKKLEVKTTFLPPHISVYTDEYTFSTILNNLISNAVKYCNDRGTIEIKTYEENNLLVIEIQNTGYGIPREEIDCIFEKFYRSYASERTEIKGFGLGLPIVKRFCTLLNIDIQITSEINKLTIAKLTIPLKSKPLS